MYREPDIYSKLEAYLREKEATPDAFKIPEFIKNADEQSIQQAIIDRETLFGKWETLFDDLDTIELPEGTLIFHSNHYLSSHLQKFEPNGTAMKIQDIRTYSNKSQIDGVQPKFTESFSRIYANFTPAGCMKVMANLTLGMGVYRLKNPLKFKVFTTASYNGRIVSLKDSFGITGSNLMKHYINKYNNSKTDNKDLLAGFLLLTWVDSTDTEDTNASFIPLSNGKFSYPEILLLECFNKFIKIGQFDLIDRNKNFECTFNNGIAQEIEMEWPKDNDEVGSYIKTINEKINEITQTNENMKLSYNNVISFDALKTNMSWMFRLDLFTHINTTTLRIFYNKNIYNDPLKLYILSNDKLKLLQFANYDFWADDDYTKAQKIKNAEIQLDGLFEQLYEKEQYRIYFQRYHPKYVNKFTEALMKGKDTIDAFREIFFELVGEHNKTIAEQVGTQLVDQVRSEFLQTQLMNQQAEEQRKKQSIDKANEFLSEYDTTYSKDVALFLTFIKGGLIPILDTDYKLIEKEVIESKNDNEIRQTVHKWWNIIVNDNHYNNFIHNFNRIKQKINSILTTNQYLFNNVKPFIQSVFESNPLALYAYIYNNLQEPDSHICFNLLNSSDFHIWNHNRIQATINQFAGLSNGLSLSFS